MVAATSAVSNRRFPGESALFTSREHWARRQQLSGCTTRVGTGTERKLNVGSTQRVAFRSIRPGASRRTFTRWAQGGFPDLRASGRPAQLSVLIEIVFWAWPYDVSADAVTVPHLPAPDEAAFLLIG